MIQAPEFKPFPKMARLSRDCIITEKLDGTNAQIVITEHGNMYAGSRTKWITPKDDNYGFASWVQDNSIALLGLGVGQHFGEWWGKGIQRKYNIDEKRFSLFNTTRWCAHDAVPECTSNPDTTAELKYQTRVPSCCHVVPVLYKGTFHTEAIQDVLDNLRIGGSIAAPGFMNPEGIIVFHTSGRVGFKKTILKDEVPKGYKK